MVALKRLRSGDAATERDRLRFQTEAQAAARLSHPNIVKILDFGDLDGEPFLAMDYIEGRSLKERLADGPLPVSARGGHLSSRSDGPVGHSLGGHLDRCLPRSVAVLADGHWGIVCAAMHPDGRRLIVSDAGGALVLWDLESAQVINRLAEPRWLAPDNDRFRAGRPNHYLLGRTAEDGSMLQWELCCADLVWDGDSSRAVAASLNGMGIVFDTDSGDQTVILQATEPLYAVSRAADAGHVLFGGAQGGTLPANARRFGRGRAAIERQDNHRPFCDARWDGLVGWHNRVNDPDFILSRPSSSSFPLAAHPPI